MPNIKYTRMLLASACAFACAMPAYAQDTAAEETDPNIIIVTAQNRSQNVNDVPIAINVITGEQLQNAGFSNMNDIGKISPVVQLNQDQGTVKVTVRGVGTGSADEAQDTSVVVNIDGEYINRPNVLGVSMFDIDRVEVLRGPQGTLYGRNSTGGAINFITRKPGKDFGVNLSGSYGNYDAVRLDGGIDIPAGDIAGLRVAGFYEKRDGYTYHPDIKQRSDDNESYGGRASLRFDPTDALSINLAGEYAERHFVPAAFAATNLNGAGNGPTGPGCNASGYTRVAPAYSQTLCTPSQTNFLSGIDRGSYNAPLFGLGQIDQKTWAVRGRIAYEFSPAATLSYTGGYRDFDQGSYLTLPIVYRSYTFEDKAKTQSHEIRLNGEVGGVIYQVGGFYFKEELDRENGFFLPIGPNGTYLSYFGRDVVSDSKSVFGQVEVPLGETLTAVGGLRYTKNKRDAVYVNGTPFGFGPPDAFLVAPGTPTSNYLFNSGPGRKDLTKLPYATTLLLGSDESKVTWLAGLNYKPNSDTLVFAKVSTGFKGGGFDSVGDYKPETNTAYELGWKQSFGESSQHQFNLGGFYYDYRDLQVSVLLDTTVGGQTFNAGKAKIWGVEASADFKLSDNDTFSASFNYLNAEYKDLKAQFNVYTVPGTGADVNGVGDLDPTKPGVQQPNFAGNRPPFSPEFVITVGYDHVFNLGGAGSVTAAAFTTFKSSYFTDFYNYRDGQQKAFTQTDLSLTYKPESDKFSVVAFVKNLENTRALTYGSFVSAGPDDIYNWQFGTPRTYGVRFSVDF
ncbi:TonB-dependent receptor [Novosphingobium sp. MMS21-SN21R]|uniref:TonB-dependent receptor n=1 Tax=Novosphingobium sp. MMS21-SN21R TaxID=2969298 RepID=UPI0028882DCD|nr:TonB-dependent receptor [Novosphingobium sp. MMS21-SN21R]MDT0506749.1 TonB-dependent receptor [Novosphingobium sp. MMS21-SN21R]